ncbi:MAG: VOC family protein, partial [Alphaproteobacteria bacterium]
MKRMLAANLLAVLMVAACNPGATPPQTAAATPAPAAPTPSSVKDPLLSAVGIGVSDLDRSVKFYTEVMGMKVLTKYDLSYIKEVVVGYPGAESYVVLMHWIDGTHGNYKDLPVKLVTRTADPAALAAKIKAGGGTVTREPTPSAEV